MSEEESMVENKTDLSQETDKESQVSNITNGVIVADVDKVTHVETGKYPRSRRANDGTGVERL